MLKQISRTSRGISRVLLGLLIASCAKKAEPSDAGSAVQERPSAVPLCDGPPKTLCFLDTAHVRDIDTEPGTVVDAHWIYFEAAPDSLEFRAGAGGQEVGGTYLSASVGPTLRFQERDDRKNTAPYVRFRMSNSGVIGLRVSVDDFLGDTVPYTLRIHRPGHEPPPTMRATGQRATLTLLSQNEVEQISVIPLGVAHRVRDRSMWTVLPRTYRVALLPDSLYELCKLPCSRPDTVKLTPSADVSKRF